MPDHVFRSAPEPVQPRADLPEPEINDKQVMSGETDNEPVEIRETGGRSIVLDALGIDENLVSLPAEDKANISEVRNYVLDIVKSKGLNPTVGAFKKTLDSLKGDMGLDEEAEPSIVLDRIAGVCKAWRNLSFVNDPDEKRTIFLKLATMKSSKEMNKQIFKIMEQYQVWR